jgi:hypothetical protein
MTGIRWGELEPLQTQQLISALLVRTVPNAQVVDGAGGDDGADVVAPIAGGIHVYEIKSFTSRLTASQRRQVEHSLATARNRRTNMVAWTLVLPLDPSPAEERWMREKLDSMAGVPVAWMGRTQLEAAFAERPDLARAFLPGSAQQQALQWLSAHGHEEAGLGAGVPNAVSRGRKLRQQLRVVDPDYDFDLDLHAGGTTIHVSPKDAQAMNRRPIAGALSVEAAAGTVAAEAIEEFHVYGAPLKLASENITGVSIDLPGGLNALIEGRAPTGIEVGPTESEPRRARFVAVSGIKALARLSVVITQTSRGTAGGARLVATDEAKTLRLELRMLPDGRAGGVNFTLSSANGGFPGDALPAARFLAKLAISDTLRLEIPDEPTATMRLPNVDAAVGAADVVELLEALERVQDATGVTFPVPSHLSVSERQNLAFVDGLLTQGELDWWWPGFAVTMTADSVRRQVLPAGVLPRISVNGSGSRPVLIAGHELTLKGTVVMSATDVVVTNPLQLARQLDAPDCRPDSPLVVHLEADSRTVVRFRLEGPPATEPTDSTNAHHPPGPAGRTDNAAPGTSLTL